MRQSPPPRKVAELSDSIRERLNLYALGTSAAGAAVVALASAAEAKIVYTPAHMPLVGTIIDLNHDGKGDITFLSAVDATTSVGMRSVKAQSASSLGINEVVATAPQDHAVALRTGERIGPGRHFGTQGVLYGDVYYRNPAHTVWFGQWANGGKGLKNRYLGIKFTINGEFHYGWARISVSVSGHQATSVLSGYAYETIPGKAIIAGATESSDDESNIEQPNPASLVAPAPGAATLGSLALGAHGSSIWRRESLAFLASLP
jgi:hypothetical protein